MSTRLLTKSSKRWSRRAILVSPTSASMLLRWTLWPILWIQQAVHNSIWLCLRKAVGMIGRWLIRMFERLLADTTMVWIWRLLRFDTVEGYIIFNSGSTSINVWHKCFRIFQEFSKIDLDLVDSYLIRGFWRQGQDRQTARRQQKMSSANFPSCPSNWKLRTAWHFGIRIVTAKFLAISLTDSILRCYLAVEQEMN